MRVDAVRQFANYIGEGITYIELEADHLLIMKQSQQAQNAISDWLDDLDQAIEITRKWLFCYGYHLHTGNLVSVDKPIQNGYNYLTTVIG